MTIFVTVFGFLEPFLKNDETEKLPTASQPNPDSFLPIETPHRSNWALREKGLVFYIIIETNGHFREAVCTVWRREFAFGLFHAERNLRYDVTTRWGEMHWKTWFHLSPKRLANRPNTISADLFVRFYALGFPNAWYTNQHYAVLLETKHSNRTLCLDVVNNVTNNALIVHCFQTLFTICCYKQCANNTLCPGVVILYVRGLLTKFSCT